MLEMTSGGRGYERPDFIGCEEVCSFFGPGGVVGEDVKVCEEN